MYETCADNESLNITTPHSPSQPSDNLNPQHGKDLSNIDIKKRNIANCKLPAVDSKDGFQLSAPRTCYHTYLSVRGNSKSFGRLQTRCLFFFSFHRILINIGSYFRFTDGRLFLLANSVMWFHRY